MSPRRKAIKSQRLFEKQWKKMQVGWFGPLYTKDLCLDGKFRSFVGVRFIS